MIDIATLTLADKGREVRYRSKGGELTEWGTITSWNDRVIFVRYHTKQFTGGPVRRRGSVSSQGTDPRDLEFVNAREELEFT